MAKVYSSNGANQDGGKIRILPPTSYVRFKWEVTFDLYVPSGQSYTTSYIVKNGYSTSSNYTWVVQITAAGQMRVSQRFNTYDFSTLPIVEDTWQTWTIGWEPDAAPDPDPQVPVSGTVSGSVDGGAEESAPMDCPNNALDYQEYSVLQPQPSPNGTGFFIAMIRNVDIREGIGTASEHQVIYLCNEESGAIGYDTGGGGHDLTLHNNNGATIHVDDPVGVIHPTSTFFGPVLATDPEATLKWQWSSTGTDPWYDVDDGVNGLPQSIQYTEVGVEAKPGDPSSIQANNQLNINSATQEQTVYLRCKATTVYDEIFSSVNTLTIVEAP